MNFDEIVQSVLKKKTEEVDASNDRCTEMFNYICNQVEEKNNKLYKRIIYNINMWINNLSLKEYVEIALFIFILIAIPFSVKHFKRIEDSNSAAAKVIPVEQSSENANSITPESYSFEDFKHLYTQYIKTAYPETSGEVTLKKEDVSDITPKEVRDEIGCQIFKIKNNFATYVAYKSKLYQLGTGGGGFGVVSIKTCDFDGNGQKDLIFTFSSGSGMHRSEIGVFNLSKGKGEVLDFMQRHRDIMLGKISDKDFKVYLTFIPIEELNDFNPSKLSKQEHVADVHCVNGIIKVTEYNKEKY